MNKALPNLQTPHNEMLSSDLSVLLPLASRHLLPHFECRQSFSMQCNFTPECAAVPHPI